MQPTEVSTQVKKYDAGMFTIDRIIVHLVYLHSLYRYAKNNEVLYLVKWYYHEANNDTWELIHHFPRSRVFSYARKEKFQSQLTSMTPSMVNHQPYHYVRRRQATSPLQYGDNHRKRPGSAQVADYLVISVIVPLRSNAKRSR